MRSIRKVPVSLTRSGSAIVKGSVLAASLIFGSAAHASLSFTFDYSANAPGVGFDDPTTGAARKAAMVTAGMKFSDMFGTFFNQTANIVLLASSSDVSKGDTLATAGSNSVSVKGFGGGEVVRNKVMSNGATDLNGTQDDGTVDINWGAGWELNYDTPAVHDGLSKNFDLYATLFHEFTHALGFSSDINQDGTDSYGRGTSGTGVPGSWSKFDQYLTTCDGTPLIDPASGLTNLTVYTPAITSSVCFQSAEVGSAKLFTPNPYAEGSSVSHLDGSGANTNAMMKFDRDTGPQEARVYNTDEVHILTSLGYNLLAVNAVPEPGSIALFLAALGGVAFCRRRQA